MGLATAQTDIVPLYERPTLESARTDEVLYGMSVQVIEQSDKGWSYLRTEYGAEGYTPSAGLQLNADVAAAWRKYKKATVLAPYIDIQKAASATSPRMASAPRGGIVVALGKPGVDGWMKVGLTGGEVGYTRASYLGDVISDWSLLAEADMRWNLVETALSYNGAAYRTGGRTPMGMDSVGLVAMSYSMNGLQIPREPFYKEGGALHKIEFEDMGEGDVLYFSSGMGIYIGDNRFVHATDLAGNEGVLVNSLRPKDDDYRGDLAGHIVAVASVY